MPSLPGADALSVTAWAVTPLPKGELAERRGQRSLRGLLSFRGSKATVGIHSYKGYRGLPRATRPQ